MRILPFKSITKLIIAIAVLWFVFFSYNILATSESSGIPPDIIWQLDYIISDQREETPPGFFGYFLYPLIQFESENSVAGHDGCNEFSASYSTKNDKINFCSFGQELLACYSNMQVEQIRGNTINLQATYQEFLPALDRVTRYEIDANELELRLYFPDFYRNRVMVFHPSLSQNWNLSPPPSFATKYDIFKCGIEAYFSN